jgi:mitofissin-like protein
VQGPPYIYSSSSWVPGSGISEKDSPLRWQASQSLGPPFPHQSPIVVHRTPAPLLCLILALEDVTKRGIEVVGCTVVLVSYQIRYHHVREKTSRSSPAITLSHTSGHPSVACNPEMLGKLVHIGFDAVLVSVVLAGIKRSTGLTCVPPFPFPQRDCLY